MLRRFTNFQEPNVSQQCLYKYIHVDSDEIENKIRKIKISAYPDADKLNGLLYEKEFTFEDLTSKADDLLLETDDFKEYEKV